jgi:WD40 repeat protein
LLEHTYEKKKITFSFFNTQHNNTVRLWDVETGNCLRIFQGHPVGLVTVMWSADERRAYSCDWTGGIRIWDVPPV